MRGPRKGIDRRGGGIDRRLHKGPFAPATLDAAGEHDIRIARKRVADGVEILRGGPGIKMDRYVVTGGGQHLRLANDRLGILVTKEYVSDFRHRRRRSPCLLRISIVIVLNRR